ncbi:MAG: chemotaxis-specific protein-glutamate methyltransferase CheB [Nitrospina sp.]|jgi:two-component system chemotaxis response regulator CheB|nr:chemotaxis-specific protein-glutamate methyltransferase CheB [Nitrospina sp.]
MPSIKILVVDDSLLTQEILTVIFDSEEEIEVVGVANNGFEALELLETEKPDFITMDISMPEMDGMEAIEKIMASNPTPILVISDVTDSKVAFVALTHGALEVLPKSWLQPEKAGDLIEKIKLLSKVKVIRHIGTKPEFEEDDKDNVGQALNYIVSIASSTGGPKALGAILSNLPPFFPFPILVSQHIDAEFVESLVDFLNDASPLRILKGKEGEMPQAGKVYISPGNKHMTVNNLGIITLLEPDPGEIYHPSCNRLLSSAAEAFGDKSIGIILTGMGSDGADGMQKIKEAGGKTIAQDEKSSAIFGMPHVAIEKNCIDHVLPLNEISTFLIEFTQNQNQ